MHFLKWQPCHQYPCWAVCTLMAKRHLKAHTYQVQHVTRRQRSSEFFSTVEFRASERSWKLMLGLFLESLQDRVTIAPVIRYRSKFCTAWESVMICPTYWGSDISLVTYQVL